MSETLENLFGSKERTRLLRFFLQNPEQTFDLAEIIKKNMLNSSRTRSELAGLVKIKFVLKRDRRGKVFYELNPEFIFYPELRNLFVKANVSPHCKGLARVSKIGNIKLAVVSGAFINYGKSKADMILVGDNVSKAKLKNLMSALEAEIGKEITFVLMTMEEFKYRLNMLDKFILEFLEGPHEELIDKIPGLKRFIAQRKL
ncbi:MAG: hypothetical protein P4L62_03745 [Candidatus Pacebacteria bacterium]|nr:hypothetical protein [Candidatus Paceibacterota bacterium]MDR3583445.1 hypothetical protein [Candidatus Paceibacterota bacterium]